METLSEVQNCQYLPSYICSISRLVYVMRPGCQITDNVFKLFW